MTLSQSNRAFVSLLVVLIVWLPSLTHAQQPIPVGRAAPADVYVPVDSWVYPALDRLRGLGYLDTAFLGLRPWTRRSIGRMLAKLPDQLANAPDDPQAQEIFASLQQEFAGLTEDTQPPTWSAPSAAYDTTYVRLQGIAGLPLRDSFHLGQSLSNDYARPYQHGFNTVDGLSGSAQIGRFSLYARGEYQHAPAAAGYSPALFTELSCVVDLVSVASCPPGNNPGPAASNAVQSTIPEGPIPTANAFRVIEANVSYRILNHQISFGKSDHWFSPAQGGSFIASNNAENIYAFQIDRTEPLYIPLLSRLTGPFRYDFFVGSLKGHSDPNDPWYHIEKVSFKPIPDLEFGFSRAVIWGGKGHEPVNLHTFLRSFFSVENVPGSVKFSSADPGARFAQFDFSWRLPWLNHWLTLYSDSLIHDDISPVDAPRHAGVRPGLYLSMVPKIPRLDVRVEGVNTDPPTSRSNDGSYLYWEGVQVQGYTNKGFLMGDSFGREGKGGQAWFTYHLSPQETVQASYRNVKDAKDFIAGGTTQNSFDLRLVKRIHRQLEVSADVQHEWWKAPIYQSGPQSDTAATVRLTWFPATTGPRH
jgi:Capsule assembly protein Wzi